jgi:hypothetical protein
MQEDDQEDCLVKDSEVRRVRLG